MTENSNLRWYDRDPKLKGIVTLLKKAPEDVKSDLAMDIIQVIIQENFTTSDELMGFAGKNYVGKTQRWYDSDEMIHTAVEMLKLLNERELQIVMREIADTYLYLLKNMTQDNE
jgi:hypothetical protein